MRLGRRHSPPRLAGLLALVLWCCALPAGGLASASSKDVIKDCSEDGSIDGNYKKSELEKARKSLPSDLDEYTDCRDAIADAIASPNKDNDNTATAAGAGGGGGGIGGAIPSSSSGPVAGSTALDEAALEQQRKRAEKGGAPSIPVDGKQIKPANGPFAPADAINQLPLPVLLGLITMLLLASAAGWMSLRRRLSPEVLARLPAFMRGEGGAHQWRDRIAGLRRVALSRFRR